MTMNPRDYRTWQFLGDHPIFSSGTAASEWSSDPDVYADRHNLPEVYDPRWYVHTHPPYPTSVQAIAPRTT